MIVKKPLKKGGNCVAAAALRAVALRPFFSTGRARGICDRMGCVTCRTRARHTHDVSFPFRNSAPGHEEAKGAPP